VLAVFGVAVSVFLIVLIQSLFMGFRDRFGAMVEELPFDLWVAQDGTYDIYRSTSLLPNDYALAVAEMPGVDRAESIVGRRVLIDSGDGQDLEFVFAFESQEARAEAATERPVPQPGEIVLSNEFASRIGAGPGEIVVIGEHSFAVSSVVPASFSTLHMTDARSTFGLDDSVNYIGVSVSEEFDRTIVGSMIGASPADANVVSKSDFADRSRSTINSFTPVLGILLAIGFIVGAAVISLTIYTSTIEKSRDFGVLKALGATRVYLYKIVTTQSLAVGLCGFALGTPSAYGAAQGIAEIVPEFATIFNPLYVAGVLGIVLLMSGVSSLLPVHRISRVDPGTVFRA
jgi:putative ABC transport system permease protein